MLLDAGADAAMPAADGMTARAMAAEWGHRAAVAALDADVGFEADSPPDDKPVMAGGLLA
jgi:hypothetical protein